MHDLMEEMKEDNQYVNFKNHVDAEREEISRFDKLKKEEKLCNDEIKQFQEKLKKNNEEFATEAQ